MAVLDLSGTMTHAEVRAGVVAGNTSLVVPLAAGLVSRGETWAAELYWNSTDDPPATRSELLAALAWYGRFHLYPVMASSPAVPADMEGKLHSDHCAAVCAIGWMSPRENGLFQGEDLISPGDLRRLSGFFPGVNPAGGHIGISRLDILFRNEGGSGER
jgi:hypothetical protein